MLVTDEWGPLKILNVSLLNSLLIIPMNSTRLNTDYGEFNSYVIAKSYISLDSIVGDLIIQDTEALICFCFW